MENLLEILKEKHIELPADLLELLAKAKSFSLYQTVEEIAAVATGRPDQLSFDVTYDVPGVGQVTEAVVHRVKNGIAANYPEKYMRRRDPDTMAIGDDLPSDKVLFRDKFGSDFASLRKATLDWLENQDLAVFFYFAGQGNIGAGGIAIAPANAAFFSMGLAMLQKIMPLESLPQGFPVESVIFVAPPFRHTHFDGKQVVVHNRSESLHEVFSYNLYPGPSAKKGLYGVLLYKGTKEGWITAHCSAVQVFSP